MLEVVAAIIWKGDKFLICQRPKDKSLGMLWEFPGGKVENGETNEQALIRECREELGVTLSVKELFTEVTYGYPDRTIHLSVYDCALTDGDPVLLEHNDMKWITPSQYDDFAFCPADVEVVKRLCLKH